MSERKVKLYKLCHAYCDERIVAAQKAIESLQISANEETKSSAGDKYETGRSMMQLEMEKYSMQLEETIKLKQTISQIETVVQTDTVQTGCLVTTNQGNFYISISAGLLKLGDESFYAISPASPIGAKLLGLKVKDSFTFNNRSYTVQRIE
ncbi:3-oxoacyl-ACP synthase [Ohtaekwangia sp.]|uniref:3-oxoacyl-ACP synthase n=1 Tax=Ohtaekwangia sp. TaxID=2066019 RepID=UPI002FDCF856